MKTKILAPVVALLLGLTAGAAFGAVVDNPDGDAETPNLPAGVIALSERPMTWDEAAAFCRERGGRLPLVGGLRQWDGLNPPGENIPIEGFGHKGRSWGEVGLPVGSYWTGTVHPDFPDLPTIIDNFGGEVDFSDRVPDAAAVVCVPAQPAGAGPGAPIKKTEMEAAKDFVKQLQSLAAAGQSRELAGLAAYPLTVNGKPRLVIENADAFVKNYEAIFTEAVHKCLREHNLDKDVFLSNGQYMVGWGCLWFFPDEGGNMALSTVNADE